MSRVILDLAYNTLEQAWVLKQGRVVVQRFPGQTKRAAERKSRAIARQIYRNGSLVQLRVHLLNGQYDYEATYGSDPERHVG